MATEHGRCGHPAADGSKLNFQRVLKSNRISFRGKRSDRIPGVTQQNLTVDRQDVHAQLVRRNGLRLTDIACDGLQPNCTGCLIGLNP